MGRGIAAFDPLARAVIYHERLESLIGNGSLHWSDDGRFCARHQHERPPEPDSLSIFSGDDGQLRSTLMASSPIIDELRWGPAGSLLVSAYVHDPRSGQRSTITLDVVRDGSIAKTLTLSPRVIQASHSIPEVSGLAWSPPATASPSSSTAKRSRSSTPRAVDESRASKSPRPRSHLASPTSTQAATAPRSASPAT